MDDAILLTSKQRAYLRKMANKLEPIIHIGKGEINDSIKKQVDDALTSREILKGKVLETNELNARQIADIIAESVNAEVVQVIGRVFVFYRKNKKEPKITLPK